MESLLEERAASDAADELWERRAAALEAAVAGLEASRADEAEAAAALSRVAALERARWAPSADAGGPTLQQVAARLPTVERAVADLRARSALEHQV